MSKQVRVGDVTFRARRWTLELYRDKQLGNFMSVIPPLLPEVRFVIRAAASDAVVRRLRRRCKKPVDVALGQFYGPAECQVRRVGASVVVTGTGAGFWRHALQETA